MRIEKKSYLDSHSSGPLNRQHEARGVSAFLEGAIPRQHKWGERKAPWRVGRKYKVVHSWAGLASRRDTASHLMTCRVSLTHSSVLARRIPGTAEPGGLLSMGLHRVGHDWSNLAAAAGCLWTDDIETLPRNSPWWRNGKGVCFLVLCHLLSFTGQGSSQRVNFPVLLCCITCLLQEPL